MKGELILTVLFAVIMLFVINLVFSTTFMFLYHVIIWVSIAICIAIIFPKSEKYDMSEIAFEKMKRKVKK